MRLVRAHPPIVAAVLSGLLAVCPRAVGEGRTSQGDRTLPDRLAQLLDKRSQDKLLTDWELEGEDKRTLALVAELRTALREADDDLLTTALRQLKPTRHGGSRWELCLSEIARRGGQKWERLLAARLRTVRQRGQQLTHPQQETRTKTKRTGQLADKARRAPDPPQRNEWPPRDLEILTALRRVQKQNDPVIVLIPGKAKRSCSLDDLPGLRGQAHERGCAARAGHYPGRGRLP